MTADYDVGKFQEFIFAYDSSPFSISSHQSTFPRPYPRSVPGNPGLNYISSSTIEGKDALQALSPRNALQGRQTRSAPKFCFFILVRVCVKRQIVFSPAVACGVCSNALDGRTLHRTTRLRRFV